MNAALKFEEFQFSYLEAGSQHENAPALLGPLNAEIEEGSFTLITGATGCG